MDDLSQSTKIIYMSSSGDKHKKHKITIKIGQFFEECNSIKNHVRELLFSMLQYTITLCVFNMKNKSYKRVYILLEIKP